MTNNNFFYKLSIILLLFIGLLQCSNDTKASNSTVNWQNVSDGTNLKTATFAGGCFWCVEAGFEKIPGVVEAISGYSGGTSKNPTYEKVSSGLTDYTETVQVSYDPRIISYYQLLDVYWKNIDPTDAEGSFYDRGKQYRPVIFYHNDEQKYLAELSKNQLEALKIFDKPIVVKIEPFNKFYKAEDYHQNFYKTNPKRYYSYRAGSGREPFFKKHWGDLDKRIDQFKKPTKVDLQKILTPLQYKITQLDGTEPPFKNVFWDNKYEGIYVDVVSGEPLFISTDKFKSGTGWPSFTKTLESDYIVEKKDTSHGIVRTEVRSKIADSHLGHVFNDGPEPTGLRYCINSAALRFVPKDSMALEGYSKYLKYFNK